MARKKSSKKVLSAMRKVERKAVLLEFSGKDAKEGYTKEKARRDLLWLKQKAMLEIDQKGVNSGNFTTFLKSVKGLIELDSLLDEVTDSGSDKNDPYAELTVEELRKVARDG